MYWIPVLKSVKAVLCWLDGSMLSCVNPLRRSNPVKYDGCSAATLSNASEIKGNLKRLSIVCSLSCLQSATTLKPCFGGGQPGFWGSSFFFIQNRLLLKLLSVSVTIPNWHHNLFIKIYCLTLESLTSGFGSKAISIDFPHRRS